MPPTPSCPDNLHLSAMAGGKPFQGREALLEHVAGCRPCTAVLADLLSVDRKESTARSLRFLPMAAAASLLMVAGLTALGTKGPVPSPVAVKPAPRTASLEIEPGGDATLSGPTLILRAGACWLDTPVPVELRVPAKVRFEAGTEAEVRILPAPKAAWSLLGEAWASAPPELLVSVVSGSAEAEGLKIRAGSRLRLPSRRLEPLDTAAIDSWRIRRLEGGVRGPERTLKATSVETVFVSFPDGNGSFSTEVRAIEGHIVIRYPAGETLLGNLEAWKDASWHRIIVSWRGSGTEVFLDGKRLLKLPEAERRGVPGLGVRNGSLVLREIRP